jgi:hypothetical protein
VTEATLRPIISHITHAAPKFVIRCWSHSTRFIGEVPGLLSGELGYAST